MKVSLKFKWYDFWIGIYYDRSNRIIYFCPLPMIVFVIELKKKRG